MKNPCQDCPFKQENNALYLSAEKRQEILYAITHDAAFHCHHTIDYGNPNQSSETKKLCFGAALFLENTVCGGSRSNIAFRFGLRTGQFTLGDLRPDKTIYQSSDEFLTDEL